MPGTNAIAMYVAFDKRENGEIVPAFKPRQSGSEDEISAVTALAA